MAYQPATSAEIETKLREDFRRRLIEAGYQSGDTNDPILRILFRTFAAQLEGLYSAPQHIREAFLDELMSGLGIDRRMARPAQTIVRFYSAISQLVAAGSEVVGPAQTGEKLSFAIDAPVQVSPARIAFAATYQNETFQLLSGIEMPDEILAGHPSHDPIPLKLGPNGAIFLVVEDLPETHLSGHSLFLDVPGEDIRHALREATWCLADADGHFSGSGLLRPRRRNAGVRLLEWLLEPAEAEEDSERPAIPDGFYAGKVFVFPEVAADRAHFLCQRPRELETALGRIFRGAPPQFFDRERAWIRIWMPAGLSSLHTGIQGIALHAVSASNIVEFNQTIQFQTQGTSIPVSWEAGTDRHLVAPLSVAGEDNAPYLSEFQTSPDPRVGRYAIHNGRMDLTPARRKGNVPEAKATVRTWVTAGRLGNTVGPGQVQSFLKTEGSPTLRMHNPMPAAGGTDGESMPEARHRFAEVLLSRSRIITRADLEAAVRAFDSRIAGVETSATLERTPEGLARVQRVTIEVDDNSFQDPGEEIAILRDELESFLRDRVLYDVRLTVDWRPAREGAERF